MSGAYAISSPGSSEESEFTDETGKFLLTTITWTQGHNANIKEDVHGIATIAHSDQVYKIPDGGQVTVNSSGEVTISNGFWATITKADFGWKSRSFFDTQIDNKYWTNGWETGKRDGGTVNQGSWETLFQLAFLLSLGK